METWRTVRKSHRQTGKREKSRKFSRSRFTPRTEWMKKAHHDVASWYCVTMKRDYKYSRNWITHFSLCIRSVHRWSKKIFRSLTVVVDCPLTHLRFVRYCCDPHLHNVENDFYDSTHGDNGQWMPSKISTFAQHLTDTRLCCLSIRNLILYKFHSDRRV